MYTAHCQYVNMKSAVLQKIPAWAKSILMTWDCYKFTSGLQVRETIRYIHHASRHATQYLRRVDITVS